MPLVGSKQYPGGEGDSIFQQKKIQIVLRENLTGVALVMHQRFNHSTGHKRCLIFQGYAWFNFSPLLSTSPLKRHQRKPELH